MCCCLPPQTCGKDGHVVTGQQYTPWRHVLWHLWSPIWRHEWHLQRLVLWCGKTQQTMSLQLWSGRNWWRNRKKVSFFIPTVSHFSFFKQHFANYLHELHKQLSSKNCRPYIFILQRLKSQCHRCSRTF